MTTNYTLDLNAGLTQVLDDGTNTYLYGIGRVAQAGGTTEYFLGDALGSIRQLADPAGAVTLTQSYAPYGEITQSVGTSQTSYAFTGEATDANGLTYLRARYLDSSTGRFTQRDPSHLEANLYLYAQANPVNRIDPTGLYSDSIIKASLAGRDLDEVFGKEKYGVARWGLYWLLRDAKPFTSITLQNANFASHTGPNYPLSPDADGNWVVFDHGCELIFQNAKWGFKTLPEFLEKIDQKATANVLLSAKWWRPATLQYHWYQSSNGQRYTDFITASHMPDMLIINYSLGALAEIDYYTYIRDRYGNVYYSVGGGFTLGGSLGDSWEGYADRNLPGNAPDSEHWRVLSQGELKHIITGFSMSLSLSIGTVGSGYTIWQPGMIALFGERNPNLGLSVDGGVTWEAAQKDFMHAWDWLDTHIPRRPAP